MNSKTSIVPPDHHETEAARLFASLVEANRARREKLQHEVPDKEATPGYINFSAGGNSWPFRLFGWDNSEPGHTWTIGTEAFLSIPAPAHPEALLINARLSPLLGPGIDHQVVQIEASGTPIGRWAVHGLGHYFCIVWPRLFSQPRIDLRFAIPGARSPQALGMSGDSRVLGLMVHEIWLTPLTAVSL